MKRIDEALADLNERMGRGENFPQACYHTCVIFRVPDQALTDAYDAQFAGA